MVDPVCLEDIPLGPLPVDCLFEDGTIREGETVCCKVCGKQLDEVFPQAMFECETCLFLRLDADLSHARRVAERECKLTAPVTVFKPELEFRCTPEEYDAGNKDSYTRSSHKCACRHKCTNYDALIRNLDRNDLTDRVHYLAIRERIDQLVDDAIADAEDAVVDADDTDVGDLSTSDAKIRSTNIVTSPHRDDQE